MELSLESKPKILTVSELNHWVQKSLEEQFANVWIEGEISNFRGASTSGHCYFSLKDENAQVDVVAFRGVMNHLKFKLTEGLKVLVLGRVSLYTARGKYQVIAQMLEPQGAGALQLAFEQLKKKLEAEGLFESSKKQKIPSLPQKIGIVTSPTGAALRDILTVINRRFANIEILIYPAKVQGEGSKEEIAEGIAYLNENYPELDVLLVGRGGGAIEDLWSFNEEIVARAIFNSKIPIISCVGHEIDFTIADFVADLRAPTPSAAAELVVKNKADLLNHLKQLEGIIHKSIESKLNFIAEQLKGMARSSVFLRPRETFETHLQTLDHLFDGLNRLLEKKLSNESAHIHLLHSKLVLLSPSNALKDQEKFLMPFSDRLQQIFNNKMNQFNDQLMLQISRLEALSPLSVLSRGYSIIWNAEKNTLIKSAQQTKENDLLKIKLHHGELLARVEKTLF